MEDQLAILHGLWGEPDGWSYDGHQVSIQDADFNPKPVDVPGRPRTPIGGARPRLLVGGQGSPRSYRLAARYADEFNLSSSDPATRPRRRSPRSTRPCVALGRDPATLTRSTMAGVLIGRDRGRDGPPAGGRVQAFGSAMTIGMARGTARALDHRTPDRRARWSGVRDVGVERIMLQDFLPWDLDMIDVMGEVLVGQV